MASSCKSVRDPPAGELDKEQPRPRKAAAHTSTSGGGMQAGHGRQAERLAAAGEPVISSRTRRQVMCARARLKQPDSTCRSVVRACRCDLPEAAEAPNAAPMSCSAGPEQLEARHDRRHELTHVSHTLPSTHHNCGIFYSALWPHDVVE